MQGTIEISTLSREEKLRVMEDIWEDLSREEVEIESPDWHQNALQQAEIRMSSGQEKIVEWKAAKNELRKRFE